MPAVLAAGAVTVGIGLCQQFLLDPFGWLSRIQEFERMMFLSTIGYINFFSCYASMLWALTLGLCCKTDGKRKWLYWALFLLFTGGILIGNSDSGYLAAGCAWIVALTVSVRSGSGGSRPFAAAGLSALFLWGAGEWMGRYRPLTGISGLLAGNPAVLIAGVFCLFISGFIYALDKKETARIRKPVRKRIALAAAAVILAALAIGFLQTDEGRAFCQWNDSWGSGRGCIWRLAWEEWKKLPLLQKLIGCGPDTAALLLEPRNDEMIRILGYTVNNVHNEYLQYLITMGILGLAAYVGFLWSGLARIYQDIRQDGWKLGLGLAAAAYLAQAAVSINQSVTTPVFILFAAAALGMKEKIHDSDKKIYKNI